MDGIVLRLLRLSQGGEPVSVTEIKCEVSGEVEERFAVGLYLTELTTSSTLSITSL